MNSIALPITLGFLSIVLALAVWGFVLANKLDQIAIAIRKLADRPEATPAGKGEP